MMAKGGHRYTSFLEGTDQVTGQPEYRAVRNWIRQAGEVRTPATGRIQKLAGANPPSGEPK